MRTLYVASALAFAQKLFSTPGIKLSNTSSHFEEKLSDQLFSLCFVLLPELQNVTDMADISV